MACSITPISAFQTTNLNNRINTFNRLADRVVRALGAPLIQVELHQDQVFENISIAIEMFTKFAGYTSEYLVFDSNLYEKNKGLRLDYLFTLSNPTLTLEQKVDNTIQSPEAAFYFAEPKTMYIATSAIASSNFNSLANLSSIFESGIFQNQILDQTTYTEVLTSFQNSNTLSAVSVSSLFIESFINEPTHRGETAIRADIYNINNKIMLE
jgi:hypothetical protein